MRSALPEPGEGWRAVRRESLHVTLAFLGHLQDDAAPRVIEAVRSAVRPVSLLSLDSVVVLPPRRPRVMAVKLAGDMGELQSTVSEALASAGLYAPEKRPFLPHVTIGRARAGERRSRSLPEVPSMAFMAPSVSVYESRLSPRGASYEALATFPVLTIGADAEAIRALRLAALAESPASFGRTLEEEAARPSSWWEDLAARSAAGVSDRVFFAAGPAGRAAVASASPGGEAPPGEVAAPVAEAGMAAGRLEGEDVELWGMWVAPAARGCGLARALLDGVVAWARSTGAARVVLRVHDGVPRAAELYTSAGFGPTHREPGETHFALRL